MLRLQGKPVDSELGLAAGYVHTRGEMCLAVFVLSPVHMPQLLHVWRREREAFAVEMPLTGAPLREEECFVVGAGDACTSGVVVALRFPTTQRALAQSRMGDRGVDQCQATRDVDDRTCLAVRHRSRAALSQEWCHHDSSPQDPRKTLSDPSIQPQKSRRQARNLPPGSRKPDLARASTNHEAAKTDLKETTKLGQRADSVADEDLLPVEHVPSGFRETILVRSPSAQEVSAERTPRAPRVLGDSAGAVNNFASQIRGRVESPRSLNV